MVPGVVQKARRVFDLPHPLNRWDDRNSWQQFYFVQHGEEVKWAAGGPGTALARETHGRWAHVFATLESKHHAAVPTFCFTYTSDNQMKFMCKYECFKAVNVELTGSYPAPVAGVKTLFKNRLVSVSGGIKNVTKV
jgi:hypothetical protein